MTTLGHTELFVRDPVASAKFYTEVLGFELEVIQGGQFAWVKMGDRSVLLRPGKVEHTSDTYQQSQGGMVIYTDDMEKTIAEYKQRGLEFKGTDDNCPTFTDPDGHWFQLVNPAEH